MASSVTLDEKRFFHTIDRQVYYRLLSETGLDPSTSKRVIAFWFWLEQDGFKRYLIKELTVLASPSFRSLVMETLTCLDFLSRPCFFVPSVDTDRNTPFMRCLVSQAFTIRILHERRQIAIKVIESFLKDMCDDVFNDVVLQYLINGVRIQAGVPQEKEQENLLKGSTGEVDSGYISYAQMVMGGKNRTLSVTFSQGYPMSEPEIRDFMTRQYGDCVESIILQVHQQPQFARVILKSASAMENIFGKNVLIKLVANGKDVWLRRYINSKTQ